MPPALLYCCCSWPPSPSPRTPPHRPRRRSSATYGQTTISTEAQLNDDAAQDFTTGRHATGYKLTGVDMEFGTVDQAGTYSTFTVAIHEDSSSSPGTLVGTLTVPSISTGSDQTISFAASGDGLDLAPNTRYWIVFDVTAAGIGSGSEGLSLV
ncbi:MAG: hypothetical protein F4X50_10510, partial [Synechococcus sp. SB0662_bin_14]|nr:hypothetical protein [Synechococcus sp. SB0662_bin_14]